MRMHPVWRLAVISRAAFRPSLAELICAGRPHMQGRCAADYHVKRCRLVLCILWISCHVHRMSAPVYPYVWGAYAVHTL